MEPAGSLVLIVPGPLETCSGGYAYDRRMLAGLRHRGWSVTVRTLDASFPRPSPAALDRAARELAAIPDGSTVLIDGLALGAMPGEVEHEHTRLRLIALVHHPLAAETGIDRDAADELESSERRALAAVRLVVVTSRATRASLAHYGVGRDRIAVVEPGTDRAAQARGSKDGLLHLLCVAALIPRKGHNTLARALATIADGRWRLTCVGSVQRDPHTVEQFVASLRADGLEERVLLAGEVDESTLAACYDAADVFVLPTFYEGYGMAVAEALAHGLPVISSATGAIPELLTGGAGLLVPPGDPEALAGALLQVLDPDARAQLAEGAREARTRLSTWEDAADKMADVLRHQLLSSEFR
jgi:glycosyltransferase involved in cell wall biosynthesis